MTTHKTRLRITIIVLSMVLLNVPRFQAAAQSESYTRQWNDPILVQRINDGIERHRKGDVVVSIKDATGKPVNNAAFTIEQVGHEFLFGANIFMLGGFDAAAENEKFEKYFTRLFNYASVPFYWKSLEPQRGNVRFAANSEKIYRRPPPDAVVPFCEKNNLTMKGHTLVWEHPTHSMPDWAPKDTAEVRVLIENRIRQIAERYGSTIKIWDVVNESLKLTEGIVLPKDYVFDVFKMARKYFPDAQLLINEITPESWEKLSHVNAPYYLQIQNLLLRGAPVDGIGLQFHFFNEDYHHRVARGEAMTPSTVYRALDLLADFRKPVHITEITIPSLPEGAAGEQIQARMTENFYKLWFSHPQVEAITWWNMVDNTAVPGEDKWRGGVLRRDFSEKPSFAVLDNLINNVWHTRLAGKTSNGEVAFRGFYGTYKIRITRGRKTIEKEFKVEKNGGRRVEITI